MNPAGRAPGFIETELDRELTLHRISADGDITRCGFSRLFSMNTGRPVMRYHAHRMPAFPVMVRWCSPPRFVR